MQYLRKYALCSSVTAKSRQKRWQKVGIVKDKKSAWALHVYVAISSLNGNKAWGILDRFSRVFGSKKRSYYCASNLELLVDSRVVLKMSNKDRPCVLGGRESEAR